MPCAATALLEWARGDPCRRAGRGHRPPHGRRSRPRCPPRGRARDLRSRLVGEDPGLPAREGADARPVPAARQGTDLLRGGRQPHLRLVLERGDEGAHPADRAAAVRLRAADGGRSGLGVQGHRAGAAEGRGRRLGGARSAAPRRRGAVRARRSGARGSARIRRGARPRRRAPRQRRRHGDRRSRLAEWGHTARHGRRARRRAPHGGDRDGAHRRLAGRDASGDLRARRRVVRLRRDHGQGDQGEGAAGARRRAGALDERVRHPRRAARRHRGAHPRAARGGDRERLSRECGRRARPGVEGEPGRPAGRVARPRAPGRLRALARAARHRDRELPADHRPNARRS